MNWDHVRSTLKDSGWVTLLDCSYTTACFTAQSAQAWEGPAHFPDSRSSLLGAEHLCSVAHQA